MPGRLQSAATAALMWVLVLSACSGDGFTEELVMSDFAYTPADIVLPADTPGNELLLVNDGEVPHDFSVEGLPDDILVHLSVFEGHSLAYPLPSMPAGTYTIYCALEGHREAGMQGTLTVA